MEPMHGVNKHDGESVRIHAGQQAWNAERVDSDSFKIDLRVDEAQSTEFTGNSADEQMLELASKLQPGTRCTFPQCIMDILDVEKTVAVIRFILMIPTAPSSSKLLTHAFTISRVSTPMTM